jgi:hypothetical protein
MQEYLENEEQRKVEKEEKIRKKIQDGLKEREVKKIRFDDPQYFEESHNLIQDVKETVSMSELFCHCTLCELLPDIAHFVVSPFSVEQQGKRKDDNKRCEQSVDKKVCMVSKNVFTRLLCLSNTVKGTKRSLLQMNQLRARERTQRDHPATSTPNKWNNIAPPPRAKLATKRPRHEPSFYSQEPGYNLFKNLASLCLHNTCFDTY